MRVLLLLLMALVLASCSPAPAPSALDGPAISAALSGAGLPVSDVRVFNADTDPNKLLGRPDQYVAKVSWRDSRGGDDATIEVFATDAALKARQASTEAISKSSSMFAQYIYANPTRRLLLRLPHELTPDQAAQYETWLKAL